MPNTLKSGALLGSTTKYKNIRSTAALSVIFLLIGWPLATVSPRSSGGSMPWWAKRKVRAQQADFPRWVFHENGVAAWTGTISKFKQKTETGQVHTQILVHTQRALNRSNRLEQPVATV